MAFKDKYTTSVHGRRLGLQAMTTPETGSNHGKVDFIVGAEAVRMGLTTSPSTGTNLKAYGVMDIAGTSADSSSVFTIDPPIPGIPVFLYFRSTGDTGCYVKTANSETIHSTIGSSHTTIKSTIGGVLQLIGLTTAKWAAIGLTSGTSSNAGGFTPTTST